MFKTTLIILTYFLVVSTARANHATDNPETVAGPLQLDEKFYQPRWSPDGRWIAVTKQDYTGIYLIDVLTQNLFQLSDRTGAGFHMQWSPDGEMIVSNISNKTGLKRSHAAAVYKVSGNEENILTQFTNARLNQFKWEGSKTLFIWKDDNIQIVNLEGNTSALTGDEIDFIVSDGETIIRYSNQNDKKAVIPSADGEKLNLSVSPGRTRIVYEILGGHMWTSKSDGSDLVDLGFGNRPRWNTSGDKILFMKTKDDGYTIISSDIYKIKYDGTGIKNITQTKDLHEIDPDWSPDEKNIIYGTTVGEIIIQRYSE